jgi:hypothetical protein
LTDFPLSVAPLRLVQVLRLGGLDARLVNYRINYDEEFYPYDLKVGDDDERVLRLLAEADVVHFHNHWSDSRILADLPGARDLAAGKPAVIQFHSRRLPQFEPALAEPALVKLVIAQYHPRLYPECRPVPNVVPIDDPLHRPLGVENDPPVVAFTPPNCTHAGWGDKGCPETLAVLARGFSHRFATGVPWEEAMRLRQGCDVAIDEIKTGSYHMVSLEALSQGLATVAGLDALTVDALEAVTGTRDHPWVVAGPATLHRELTRLVEDHDYRRAKRREARSYMERYWNPAAVAARFGAIYREARERAGR